MFDVGIIYSRRGRFYLAVSDKLLLTIGSGGIEEVEPGSRNGFADRRRMTVKDLVRSWRITLPLLDEITNAYMDVQWKRNAALDNKILTDLSLIFGTLDDDDD